MRLPAEDPTLRDDCNRTENPLSHGGQWSVGVFPADTGVPEAIGTVCDHSGTGVASAWWQAASFAANQAASATMPDATAGTGANAALYLRIQAPGTAGADVLSCDFFPGNTPNLVRVSEWTDSVHTLLN